MTTYREFTYQSDEWCCWKTIITADLELVLSADPSRDIVAGIRLEAVLDNSPRMNWLDRRNAVPIWLSDAMTAWVRDNQDKLETVRRRHFAEAAE